MQELGKLPYTLSNIAPAAHTVPPLVMSSSNVSTSTLNSELISPDTSQETNFVAVGERSSKTALRDSTSPSGTATSDDSLFARDTASLNVGSKRTASGTVKSVSPTRVARAPQTQHNTSVKRQSAIELSADLRTRLKYAMIKVQNGWEAQNIEQLEQLPIASPKRALTDSPTVPYRRDSSASSETLSTHAIQSPFFMSPMADHYSSPTSNIRGSYDTSRVLQRQLQHQAPSHLAQPTSHSHGLGSLAPPAQITSQRRPHRKSISSRLGGPIGRVRSSSSVSQGITNQAEHDAVASLMFMSSPVNRAVGRAAALAQAESPSRSKRVDFDMTGTLRT